MTKNKKNGFNIIDALVIICLCTAVFAGLYFFRQSTETPEKAKIEYTVFVTVKNSAAEKFKVGDDVLTADGSAVCGQIISVEEAPQYILSADRRRAPTLPLSTTETTVVTLPSQTETASSVWETASTAAPVTTADLNVRSGELVIKHESNKMKTVKITVSAAAKYIDGEYFVDGTAVKAGKNVSVFTSAVYAEGECIMVNANE